MKSFLETPRKNPFVRLRGKSVWISFLEGLPFYGTHLNLYGTHLNHRVKYHDFSIGLTKNFTDSSGRLDLVKVFDDWARIYHRPKISTIAGIS